MKQRAVERLRRQVVAVVRVVDADREIRQRLVCLDDSSAGHAEPSATLKVDLGPRVRVRVERAEVARIPVVMVLLGNDQGSDGRQ